MIYRDVMWENFWNVAAVERNWDDYQVEEEYNSYRKNLRNEDLKKCHQHKLFDQYREMVFMTSNHNVHMKLLCTKPDESVAHGKLWIGHSSPLTSIIVNTGLKSCKYHGFELNCHRNGKTYTDFQSFQDDAKSNLGKNLCEYREHEKSYSDQTEERNLEEEPFFYKTDMKAFHTLNHVQIHEGNHSMVNTYVSIQCGKDFTSLNDIQKHERTHSGEKSSLYTDCGKSFKSFDSHESTDIGRKPHVCKQCGKAFSQHSHCQIRERTQSGEKPYVCKQCGKAFSTRSDCQKHERTHTGEKPYVCKQCGKAFTSRCSCERHKRTHTGEKPYVCKQCGKAFSTNSHCRTHERIHIGEKPYVCMQCGNAFSQHTHCQIHE
ncbi:zinc finger protein 709-like [Cavia porcellus]|uniref:zinc finger protein 709-like n=1 Tax=Cavia porcellus TaxID=10141 RepID=UPI002FE0D89F